ncbi:NAD(P)-dependent oxidoreductase [Methylovulum psychrotolerans]|uniref:Prephenate dehydrogenase/arogenate dehydrogenase family protein n=1 Tax=Methylovulum psychrotolerans TaxID=1704499 RepID=A0A2S5CS53_9GAMM|nr:NAD(P)-dependent oxidoreductase [Methylovulum psychrotolerans]POZ53618.1 prephenate dehydrogenase/arogenate dehydrogenase family protein [Methylovulum psychrotolerans]
MQVAMVGLGAMGEGMARNLAKAGFLTAVYNRTAAKAEALANALAVRAYPTLETLAADMDVVFLCVSADSDVLAVVSALAAHLKSGAVVVDMSTVSSATAQQAAAMLAMRQVAFLDAPVSGGVEGAKNGTLSMMVGGEAAIVGRVRPLLESMSARVIHLGATGAGQATKAVNQVLCAGINQAVTEALAFAQAQQLPMELVIDAVAGGAAGNWFLDHRGKTMVSGSFAPGFKLALHHKDLKICQAMAAMAGVEIPLAAMTVLDYQGLMAAGHGDEDISALYRIKSGQRDK